MKVTLYAAVTIDGLIAKADGDSDWVSEEDWPNVEAEIKKAGCVVVGRRTFQQYQGEMYPIEGVLNLVLSRRREGVEESDGVKVVGGVDEALKVAKESGCKGVLVIGGGKVDRAFLEAGLVNELIVTVNPLVLGEGICWYGGSEMEKWFELEEVVRVGKNLVRLTYKKTDGGK